MTDSLITTTAVQFGNEVEDLVLEVLRSGHIVQGPVVAKLEESFRHLVGVDEAVAVSSGTAALSLALRSLDLESGDEVITSAFTFAATLNAIIESGAVARFADIDGDFNFDPSSVESLVNDRTRVVMPVHLFGKPAEQTAVAAIAASHDLRIVEDAAQAIGATHHGRSVGALDVGCFSLYATKNVTSAEGGVVTTTDGGVADRIRVLRNQGMGSRYEYVEIGGNFRLTDVHAAICLPQMSLIHSIAEARRRNAARLVDGLCELDGLELPTITDDPYHVVNQFTVRVKGDAPLTRSDLIAELETAGIIASVFYPRVVWDYDCYRQHPRVKSDEAPRATAATSEVVSLPVHQHLGEQEIERVIDAVCHAFLGAKAGPV